jgi:hypothetical protein
MFEYVNDDEVSLRIDSAAAGVFTELQLIEQNTEGSDGLAALWNDFCES